MQKVIETVITCISPTKIRVLNFVDRCCTRYTPIFLSILMFITGTIDTYGKPLNCMLPQEFSAIWANFVHQYCYVTGTYIKHNYNDEGIPERMYVDYYQWVPFLLLAQLLIMRFPNLIWRYAQTKSDIDYDHVYTLCQKIRTDEAEKRSEYVDQAASYIYKVAIHRGFRGIGNKLLNCYLLFKLMNILTIVLVIYLLCIFVGKESLVWGISVFKELVNGNHAPMIITHQPFKYFPRVVYCEFGRDFLGHEDGRMVEETRCTLGINVINEKVFLMLYFWYHILLTATIADVIYNIVSYINEVRWHCLSKELLQLVKRKDVFGENAKDVSIAEADYKKFSQQVLGRDGLLLFRFLKENVGKLIASEICSRLYILDKIKDEQQQCNSVSHSTALVVRTGKQI